MLTRDSKILVGQGREEIHPLVNSDILGNIFIYLDMKSLKLVRQTCSFWNDGARSSLQKKSKVTINWYNNFYSKNPTLPMFMKYVESVGPENVFFQNYELYNWRLHSKEKEMTEFWLKCGEHIRDLRLGNYEFGFYEESYVRNVFYNWTPNLESMYLEVVRFANDANYVPWKKTDLVAHYGGQVCKSKYEDYLDSGDDENKSDLVCMPKFEILEDIQPNYNFHTFHLDPSTKFTNFPLQWKELFLAYPNLKSLTLKPLVVDNDDVDNIRDLLTDLIQFQEAHPNKINNLKHLDIFNRFNTLDVHSSKTEEHYKEATKLNFNLESLVISIGEVKELNYSTVANYITKLSSSLRRLLIASDCAPYGPVTTLTIFPPPGNKICSFLNLTFLRVDLCAFSSADVGFLKNTPNLITLEIGQSGRSGTAISRLFVNTITLEPLNTLRHLNIGEDILTEDCIRKIGEWFPNLSKFKAVLDDNLLWAVYKYLNNSVVTLEVAANGVTDAGITGITRIHYDNEGQRNLQRSIGNMKKLQHLTMMRRSTLYVRVPNNSTMHISDEAVYMDLSSLHS